MGILLTIPEKITKREVYDHSECTVCHNKGDGKFCPVCGNVIEIKYKTELVDAWDDLDEDWIYQPEYVGYHLLKNGKNLMNSGEYIIPIDFNTADEITKFMFKYENELAHLEEMFGKIKIEFGVITYWS